VKILFLADVFGVPGRRAVEEHLPALRERYEADLAIVNGENAADGAGITGKLADKLLAAGADVVTLGNHTYRRGGVVAYLAGSKRVIRPANAGAEAPGHGLTVVEARNGVSVAVLNLLGQLFLPTPVSPWEMVDTLVDEARAAARVVFVDFHAEATSEKIALATWLDGRVTAVIGTHTHVQTNDARILPGGTAALTDAGMTGPHDSVIGVRSELAIARMRTPLPIRFEPAEGDVRLEGTLVTCTNAGRAEAIELVRVSA
jgi:2',3'-cyclic-nucleotide 2'-phosphodiesterase